MTLQHAVLETIVLRAHGRDKEPVFRAQTSRVHPTTPRLDPTTQTTVSILHAQPRVRRGTMPRAAHPRLTAPVLPAPTSQHLRPTRDQAVTTAMTARGRVTAASGKTETRAQRGPHVPAERPFKALPAHPHPTGNAVHVRHAQRVAHLKPVVVPSQTTANAVHVGPVWLARNIKPGLAQ